MRCMLRRGSEKESPPASLTATRWGICLSCPRMLLLLLLLLQLKQLINPCLTPPQLTSTVRRLCRQQTPLVVVTNRGR